MAIEYIYPPFEVIRRDERCTRCRICEKQCANGVHTYDAERKIMLADESKCVNCQRCVALCPTRAIKIVKTDCCLRENENWKSDTIREVYKQAATGGILLSSTGNPTPLPGYWDRLLINASQVTNPSIDPLREPMETRVFLGKKPDTIRRRADGSLDTTLPPQLELSVPILFSAMSYGSISYNAHAALARAAEELGIYYNTGEGGLHRDFYKYGANTIVQVASGRFGIEERCLNAGAAIEIKMGQGAKPGIGGHLPGAKIVGDVSKTRMIPEGSDAISPAPHHDIYSIEDLRQLVNSVHRRLYALLGQPSADQPGEKARPAALAAHIAKLPVLPARNQQTDRVRPDSNAAKAHGVSLRLILSVYIKIKLLLDLIQIAHLIDDFAVPAIAVVPARRALDEIGGVDLRQRSLELVVLALRVVIGLRRRHQLLLLTLQAHGLRRKAHQHRQRPRAHQHRQNPKRPDSLSFCGHVAHPPHLLTNLYSHNSTFFHFFLQQIHHLRDVI